MRLLVSLTLALVLSACSGDEDDPKVVDCAALNEADCLAESECLAVYGHRIDETAMCYSSVKEMMVCAVLAVAECPNNAVGYATDPDGVCWLQPSICGNIGDGYDLNPPDGSGSCPVVSEICP